MKIITRKPQPKFARKQNSSIQKTQLANVLQQPNAGSNTKKLQISNNVLNLIIMAPQQNKQIELSRLLFTNQKQVDWQSTQKELEMFHSSALSKKMFLEYSPDSIINSPLKRGNTNDSEILIEGYSERSEKGVISTHPATNFTFQKSQECDLLQDNHAKITPFELEDVRKTQIPASSITLTFITSNSFIFMVSYTFKSEARMTLKEQSRLFKEASESLINRMRKFFKKFPLLMFNFYLEVLSEYENIQLREFLMKNSIKYMTNEITSLEEHFNQALDICKAEELMEYIFMTEEQDDMIVVNLSDADIQTETQTLQTNFWKAMAPIFKDRLHQKEVMSFEFQKIEEFLFKLI